MLRIESQNSSPVVLTRDKIKSVSIEKIKIGGGLFPAVKIIDQDKKSAFVSGTLPHHTQKIYDKVNLWFTGQANDKLKIAFYGDRKSATAFLTAVSPALPKDQEPVAPPQEVEPLGADPIETGFLEAVQ